MLRPPGTDTLGPGVFFRQLELVGKLTKEHWYKCDSDPPCRVCGVAPCTAGDVRYLLGIAPSCCSHCESCTAAAEMLFT